MKLKDTAGKFLQVTSRLLNQIEKGCVQ